jgi:hypothetical protein
LQTYRRRAFIMKTLLLSLAFCLPFFAPLHAQEAAPIIRELRALLQIAPTGFESYRGALIEHDSATKTSYFQSKHTPEASTAQHFMFENAATKNRFYMIRYDLGNMDAMHLKIMNLMASKYMDELNTMVQSGSFTGRDYQNEDGANVTEIKDKNGAIVLEYQSDPKQQVIVAYSTKTK